MNLTQEQLERVRELSELTITPRLIANVIEVDEMDFLDEINTEGTAARRAFLTGMANQMCSTRAAIIKAAQNGSNPAQSELLKFLQDQIYGMNRYG